MTMLTLTCEDESVPSEEHVEPPGWRLDKRVPIAVVMSILIQFGGVMWWVSNVSSSVTSTQDRVTKLEAVSATNGAMMAQVQVLMARLDERIQFLIERAAPGAPKK
jgi:hypothetical protein